MNFRSVEWIAVFCTLVVAVESTLAQSPAVVKPAAPATLPTGSATPLSASAAATAGSTEEGDPFSETLMITTVSFLNQSYVSIGILADAAGKDTFEEQELADLLDLHHTLAEQVEEQLSVLAKAPGMDAADTAAINELVKLAQLNKWQCEALAAIYGGDDSKQVVWQQLRQAAYKELAKYSDEEDPAATPAASATPTSTKPAATTASAPATTTK